MARVILLIFHYVRRLIEVKKAFLAFLTVFAHERNSLALRALPLHLFFKVVLFNHTLCNFGVKGSFIYILERS